MSAKAHNKKPTVALESTVISHGLPYPRNLDLAQEMEAIVCAAGAIPRTIGIIHGQPVVGLSAEQIEMFALATKECDDGTIVQSSKPVRKISRRDLPVAVARCWHGATTVATTMWIAQKAGIEVFATGGIGGVHRGNGTDISADLQELAQTSVIVVCAGAKALLDLPATLEYLETVGVTVVGFGSDAFPAFYSRESGLTVDVRCDSAQEIIDIWLAKQTLELPGGLLVAVPVPEEEEIPAAEIEPAILQAVSDAEQQGLRSAEVTPYLLARIGELTGARSVRANLALLKNNAHVAAKIAVALVNSRADR